MSVSHTLTGDPPTHATQALEFDVRTNERVAPTGRRSLTCGTCDTMRFPFLGAPRPPRPSADSPTGVAGPCEWRESERTSDTRH